MSSSKSIRVLLFPILFFHVHAHRTTSLDFASEDLNVINPPDTQDNDVLRVIDATPLFAGTMLMSSDSTKPEDQKMCCCKKGDQICKIVGWKKKCNHALNWRWQRYHKLKDSDRLQPTLGRCLVQPDQWILDLFNTKSSNRHPKIVSDRDAKVFNSKDTRAKIFLVRHGFSMFNQFMEMEEKVNGVKNLFSGALQDALLTKRGQDEAVASQEYFRRELQGVPPSKVQFAASLLSRAYDTLIMATAQYWEHNSEIMIDQVPAMMEFGKGPDCERKDANIDISPVRLNDSSLSVDSPLVPSNFKKFYLQSAEKFASGSDWLTESPWQVQAAYPRREVKKCDDDQLKDVLLYLTRHVQKGKTHIVIGSHSQLIMCLMGLSSKLGIIGDVAAEWAEPATEDGQENSYDVSKKKLPNGAALSFDLHVPANFAHIYSLRMHQLVVAAPDRGFPKIGKLLIDVEKGLNLVDMDYGSESDPFVVVSFAGKKLEKSITVADNNNPIWNMHRDVEVASIYQVLRIEVFDKDLTGKEFMGKLDLPIRHAVQSPNEWVMNSPSGSYPLEGVSHGSIVVYINFMPA